MTKINNLSAWIKMSQITNNLEIGRMTVVEGLLMNWMEDQETFFCEMDIHRNMEKWKFFWIFKSKVHLNIIVYDWKPHIFHMST